MDIQQSLISAMSQILPRAAARTIFDRALAAAPAAGPERTPAQWTEFIRGPLQAQLAEAIPIRGGFKPFDNIVAELRSSLGLNDTLSEDPLATLEANITTEYIDLNEPYKVDSLVRDLARMDDVLGVIVEGPAGQESRMPGFGELSADILKVANFLLRKRGAYRIYYSIWNHAQVVVRPLETGWIAVIGKRDANLGQILYRLGRIQADPN